MTDAPEIIIVGDGPVASALEPMVAALGWRPVVATTLASVRASLASADAVVVLSHHEDLDAPSIRVALEQGTAYVGAMGSRRTQARRRTWLEAEGVNAAVLDRLRAPVGLDIGADEPGEIAVSILAEVIAVRRGAGVAATAISHRDGPIHPDLEPGTATCPGG